MRHHWRIKQTRTLLTLISCARRHAIKQPCTARREPDCASCALAPHCRHYAQLSGAGSSGGSSGGVCAEIKAEGAAMDGSGAAAAAAGGGSAVRSRKRAGSDAGGGGGGSAKRAGASKRQQVKTEAVLDW
jgi:hypothetical protein